MPYIERNLPVNYMVSSEKFGTTTILAPPLKLPRVTYAFISSTCAH